MSSIYWLFIYLEDWFGEGIGVSNATSDGFRPDTEKTPRAVDHQTISWISCLLIGKNWPYYAIKWTHLKFSPTE